MLYPIKDDYTLKNGDNFLDSLKIFYPQNIDLLNITDPFYNSICIPYKTGSGTDMTINDRRKEFYNDINLCENSCTFETLIDKGNNPKSLCKCYIKYKFSFDNQSDEKKKIFEKKVPNIKAITCIKETFTKDLPSKITFWFSLILIIIQIFILANTCYKGKKEIYKKLELKEKNISFPPKKIIRE